MPLDFARRDEDPGLCPLRLAAGASITDTGPAPRSFMRVVAVVVEIVAGVILVLALASLVVP